MNYIILDLEWNQNIGNKEYENKRMHFEIIEIGAVRLDEQLNITDTYSSIVKPKIYKKIHPHIREILNYDEKTLRKGKPFDMVCRDFIKWCGDDYVFCTWGSMDLNILQNNMDYYYMKNLPTPLKFFDIQQIYADTTDENNAIVKLEKAVQQLSIEIDKPFHSAVNDAYYTSLVLRKIRPKDFHDRYIYDTYNNPKEKEDEIISYHKNYMEHISREFNDKKEALEDKELFSIRCYKCKKKASKKIRWFASSPSTYTCVGKCWYHGLIAGKIKFKQTKKGKFFAIKTILPTDKKGLENIRERQEELRLKRQQKRHKINNTTQESE